MTTEITEHTEEDKDNRMNRIASGMIGKITKGFCNPAYLIACDPIHPVSSVCSVTSVVIKA